MIDFVTHNMAPLMFAGMMLFMVVGYPASFSLAAVGLFFAFIGIELVVQLALQLRGRPSFYNGRG